jgi:hypothetical protein
MGWWLVLGEFPFLLPLITSFYWWQDGCGNWDEWLMCAVNSILCSDFAIKRIDEPFVLPTDDRNEWAL